MVGSVSMFGGATGLPSDLVDRLMEVEKTRLYAMQKKRDTVSTQQSSFDTLSSKLLSLKTKAKDLQEVTSWTPHTASSSDSEKIAITASSEANAATHLVEVQRLATFNALMLGSGGTDGDNPGTGISEDQASTGLTADHTTFEFSYNGTSFSLSLETGDTLQNVADKINALDYGEEDGVSASVIFDGDNYRLVMNALDSGAYSRDSNGDTSANRIQITSLNLQFGDSNELTSTDMFTTEKGQDAKLKVDGLSNVYSSSNTVSEVIQGVTMELKDTTTSAISLTVANDKTTAKSTLQAFVDSFNDVADYINSKKSSDFSGEAAIRSVFSQFRLELNTPTSGVSSKFSALPQMGVMTNSKTGKLEINSDKFDTAVEADFTALKEIFTNEPSSGNKGLAFRLETLAGQLTASSDGLVTAKVDSLKDRISSIDNNIEKENRRLEATRKRLTMKYARLEQMVSTLNGSASAMTSALSKM